MINVLATMTGRYLAYQLFHPPRKKHHRNPPDAGLMAREMTTRTADNINLHLWLIPGVERRTGVEREAGAGTVILGHGIGLTKSASLRQAALLHERGYHVLMFDHRNHGLSGTDKSRHQLAQRYSNDIVAAMTVAEQTWPDSDRLIIWGFSFSTFPTLHSLCHADTLIDGIICDSGPGLNLDVMLRSFLSGGHFPVPRIVARAVQHPRVVHAFASAAIAMLGTSWPPEPHTSAAGDTPMLFLVGTDDGVVHPDQVRELCARYPHGTLAEFEVGHLEGIKRSPQQYRSAVGTFLDSIQPKR